MESSDRTRTKRAIEVLQREFGDTVRLFANHGENRENLYWGPARFGSPILRYLVSLLGPHAQSYFCGEDPESPFFWGDLCQQEIDYVRNFTFSGLNVLTHNPEMPYRTSTTPWANAWFSTSDAADAEAFVETVTPQALDKLETEGGVCILSTHLGKGFSVNGRLDPRVDNILRDLAQRPGWFVPVSTLLDHLRGQNTPPVLTKATLFALEVRFLVSHLKSRLRSMARHALQ